jgi:hypothetical protein
MAGCIKDDWLTNTSAWFDRFGLFQLFLCLRGTSISKGKRTRVTGAGNWDPTNLKGTKLSGPKSGPLGELRVEFSRCSGLLRLGTVLHSHSSGLLVRRSGCSHVCSGLKVEMEFGEVEIRA